jgi:hypothetical protein
MLLLVTTVVAREQFGKSKAALERIDAHTRLACAYLCLCRCLCRWQADVGCDRECRAQVRGLRLIGEEGVSRRNNPATSPRRIFG